LYSKFAARPASFEAVPLCVEKAVRATMYGRPGVAFLDLPGDLLRKSSTICLPKSIVVPRPPISRPLEAAVAEAVNLLSKAERPLVIVGKGAAYSRAENQIRAFIEKTNLPFLATPMGKGCVPDTDSHSVGPARSVRFWRRRVISTQPPNNNHIFLFLDHWHSKKQT
jgi:2-hydroxyacyl-CoA lyase 1